jgi:hypothetical protein
MRYRDFVPQPLAVYREETPGDRTAWTHKLCQCDGVGLVGTLNTWELVLIKEDDSTLRVPVFHIKRDAGGGAITSVQIRSVDDSINLPLSDWVAIINDLDNPATKEAVVFLPHTYTNIQIPPSDTPAFSVASQFYLRITDGTNVWYTEVFTVYKGSAENSDFPCAPSGNSICNYIQLGWSNSNCIIVGADGVGVIHNNTGSFQIFLPANLDKPTYEKKDDTQETGERGIAKTFERVEKTFSFAVIAPEYIADALSACQIMESVTLTFISGDFVKCKNVEVDVTWEEGGGFDDCLARIVFRFQTDETTLIKSGCC